MPSLVSNGVGRSDRTGTKNRKNNFKKTLPLEERAAKNTGSAAAAVNARFANRLVFFYVNAQKPETKKTILSLLSGWLSSGRLLEIPVELAENICDKNPEYFKMFSALAPSAPDNFAKKIMELINYSTIDTKTIAELSNLLQYLVRKCGATITTESFSENLLITIAYLINAKELLFRKEKRSQGEQDRLCETYARALAISELMPFVRITKKDKTSLLFFLAILVELNYLKPAVNIALNANLPQKEKLELAMRLHNHLSFIKKNIPSVGEEIKDLNNSMLEFLKRNNIFPVE